MSTSANFSKLLNFVNNKTSQNTQFATLPVKMNKGNNKITELRTILQRESQNS